jgi:hypothetical protein
MATPLRKDEPQFDDEEITTADLAQGKRPVSDPRGPQAVTTEGNLELGRNVEASRPLETGRALETNRTLESAQKSDDATPLFPGNELEGLRARWKEVQIAFVDEPRKAVQQADGLVASAMKRLAEVFAEERSKLEQQWDRGDNVSTEDLRVALQRYRTFFERLLSI